jgi:hypothetical protein
MALKKKAQNSSETSDDFERTTWRYDPEDNLQSQRYENIKHVKFDSKGKTLLRPRVLTKRNTMNT